MARQDEPPKLGDVIAAYRQALQQGRRPDRDEWLSRYPELADGLRAFFASYDHSAAEPTITANPALAATLHSGVPPAAGPRRGPENRAPPPLRSFGDYELLQELARGGMGVVYKARQVSLNRVVALKMILAGQFAGADEIQRFHAEAKAAASLDHPRIVPIYEVGEHEGQQYFSMKLVEGGSLAQRIPQFVHDPKSAARLLADTARAVHYAHQRGVLHRDLKPANILLDKDGQPNITDFGLAKRVEDDSNLTQSGAIVGTASYMSPEQASGHAKHLTTASDTYSLGAIFFEMLTARPPLQGETVIATLMKVRSEEPVAPRKLNPRVDRDLETICLKCLEKEPAKRYGSAEALAEDLDRWLSHEPIAARPATRTERLAKWARRHPAAAGLIGVSALAIVLLIAGLSWSVARERERLVTETALREVAEARQRDADAQRGVAEQARRTAETERAKAVRENYDSTIALAAGKVKEGELPQAKEMLLRTPRELRHWEWGRLMYLCQRELRTLAGHEGPVRCVAFSPDGKRAVTGSYDNTARIWDWERGNTVAVLRSPARDFRTIAFSPDARRVLATSCDGKIWTWDAGNGEVLSMAMVDRRGPFSTAISQDGRRAALALADYTVTVWDIETARPALTLKGHSDHTRSLAFSPDGKRILTSSADKTARLWDAATGKELVALPVEPHTPAIFSPDGKRVLTCGPGCAAALYETETGKEVLRRQTDIFIRAAFAPDGRSVLLVQGGNRLTLLDLESGLHALMVKGHTGTIDAVAVSPDGRVALTVSMDSTAKLWDISTWQDSATFSEQDFRDEFTPDGAFLATVISLGPAQGNLNAAHLRDVRTGKVLASFQGHASRMQGLAVSADGRFVMTGHDDGTMKLWDARTGKEIRTIRFGQGFCNWSASLSPDGSHGAAGGFGIAKVWDLATGRETITVSHGNRVLVSRAVFSVDGKRLLTTSHDGTARLWELGTGRQVAAYAGHANIVESAAFSADERRIVTGSCDGTARVWDAATGRELLCLKGHTGVVSRAVFLLDGTRIATAGADHTLRIWNAETGRELMAWPCATNALAVAPDGRTLFTSSCTQDTHTIGSWQALDWTRSPEELEREKLERWRSRNAGR